MMHEAKAPKYSLPNGGKRFSDSKRGAFDCGLRIGDEVCRKDDERHVGVVLSITSNQVKLRWKNDDDSDGILGYEDASDLRKVETAR